jgi:hypothetical protein
MKLRTRAHLNGLYSPWRANWAELAIQWLQAQDNVRRLKTFVNLSLRETFDE